MHHRVAVRLLCIWCVMWRRFSYEITRVISGAFLAHLAHIPIEDGDKPLFVSGLPYDFLIASHTVPNPFNFIGRDVQFFTERNAIGDQLPGLYVNDLSLEHLLKAGVG